MLGEVVKTNRGFEMVEFEDTHGRKCSVQQSSAIGDYDNSFDKPGSSFLWIGLAEAKPVIMKRDVKNAAGDAVGWIPYPMPDTVMIPTTMHLNRDQVAGLIATLESWLATGALSGAKAPE